MTQKRLSQKKNKISIDPPKRNAYVYEKHILNL